MWLVAIVFILSLVLTYFPILKWKNPPPGPAILPFLGSLISLRNADSEAQQYPFRAMHRLSENFGPVMRVALGTDVWIVLSGAEEIKQFTMMNEATFRPDMSSLNEMYAYGNKSLGVIFPDGILWQEQRKFMMKTLKQIGMGKKGMEDLIIHEVRCCSEYLKDLIKSSNYISMHDFFDLPCLNVIWQLVCAKRFEYHDDVLRRHIQIIDSFTMEKAIGPIAGIWFLKYLPPYRGIYNKIKYDMTSFKKYLMKMITTENKTSSEGYVGEFLRAKRNVDGGEFFTDEQLVVSMQDFFTGGSGTMSKTLAYAILYMVMHPDVQTKVQKELDSVAQGGQIRLHDRPRIPYTESVLMEVQRLGSVLPIAPPRFTKEDVEIGHYHIPKGSKVQINLYSMHRNQAHWSQPHKFNPERFLSSDDSRAAHDDWLQPFGYGKRKCIGENVAKATVLLFFANILLEFSFQNIPGQKLTDDPDGGLTIGPKPFKVKIEQR